MLNTKEYPGDPSNQGLLDVKEDIKNKLMSTRECIWECMTASGKSMHWPGIACSVVTGCICFITPVSVDIPDIATAAET